MTTLKSYGLVVVLFILISAQIVSIRDLVRLFLKESKRDFWGSLATFLFLMGLFGGLLVFLVMGALEAIKALP